MHRAAFCMQLMSVAVGSLSHRAHIIWMKQGAKQVTLHQRFDINRPDEVLEMVCLNESSADGGLPIWCVSHVVWSPYINYRCVSPLGARSLACLSQYPAEVFMLQRTQRLFRILDSWHAARPCGGLQAQSIRINFLFHIREACRLQICVSAIETLHWVRRDSGFDLRKTDKRVTGDQNNTKLM